jgi:hypothetical protein
MKTLFTILTIFTLLSCNKENSKNMAETLPLKAIPTATVNGLKVTLIADQSQGDICAYGWQANASGDGGPFIFTPNSSEHGT